MRLLGYDRLWSFYAALHGGFIGWMFVGCLAFLAQKKGSNRIYLIGCYLSFLFFLLVAFGIDGIPFIKRVGVIGFSVMIPVLIGYHALNSNRSDRISLSLSLLSFCAIFLSMSLALLNEFWTGFPRVLSGISTMVLTHGFLNVIVAVPCFFLAILRNIKVEQLAERTKKTQRLLRF